jgi:acetyltransferase-like isoleucine patch superfamily enzyme
MKKIFRKIIYILIKWSGINKDLDKLVGDIKKDFHHVSKYNNVLFDYSSRVINLKNDKSKIEIGDGTHISGELLVFNNGGNIKIGKDCYIGDHSRIWSADDILIGNNVFISHNVNIMDTNGHELDHVERIENYKKRIDIGYPSEKGNILTAPVTIKDFAWIGFNSIILKGVVIGEGAIVAAGSLVTKEVQPYTLVAGNPARKIKNLK